MTVLFFLCTAVSIECQREYVSNMRPVKKRRKKKRKPHIRAILPNVKNQSDNLQIDNI